MKEFGGINRNGLYYMDGETWNSIWKRINELRAALDEFVADRDKIEVFKKFSACNILVQPDEKRKKPEIISGTSEEEGGRVRDYFTNKENLEIMITDISFRPAFRVEDDSVIFGKEKRKIDGQCDNIVRVHFIFRHNGSRVGGDGEFIGGHQDICVI